MEVKNRDDLVTDNLRLVTSLCGRFVGRGIDFEDLYGAGCIGLCKAAKGFDETRGLMFSTYAVPVILGEIKRLFRDGGEVKVSRSIKELYLKCLRVKQSLELKFNREPTVSEIANEIGVDPESVAEAFCACRTAVSLTVEDGDGEKTMEIPDESREELIADRITVQMALKKLPRQEQELIKCRYFAALTQTETAKKLSMSQVQVSRTEKKVLSKLRDIIGIGI
ncbi:MAG: sigma-70 family RNA polymerase sigma factor [Clostridia bacterium]|nr:sigma-70 family RNA polymerase sigma factor [Clostridia bacterium]